MNEELGKEKCRLLGKTMLSYANSRIFFLFCSIVYAALIPLYYAQVSEVFGPSLGFNYRDAEAGLWFLALFISVVPAAVLPLNRHKVSSNILWVVYLFNFVPSVMLAQYTTRLGQIDLIFWYVLLLCGFLISSIAVFIKSVQPRRFDYPTQLYLLALAGVGLAFIAAIYLSFGFSFDVASLDDVYGVRSAYKDELSQAPGIMGYVVMLSGFWVSPAFLLIGLYVFKRHQLFGILLITIAFFSSFIVYSVAAFKSVAFGFVLTAIYFYFIKKSPIPALRIVLGVIFLIILSWLIAVLTGFEFIFFHVVRRVLLTTGMNSSYFYEYFSRLSDSVTIASPALTIAQQYYGTDGSANSGFIASAFAMYGAVGVVLVGCALAVALYVADIVSMDINPYLATALFFLQAYALSNSAFGTVMISYGFFLMVATIYLIPRRSLPLFY